MSSTGLAGRLRDATRAAHHHAESSPFVGDLLAGRLPLSAFAALVANHHAIYSALEAVPDGWAHDPVAGPFAAWPGLSRRAALRADLAALAVADPAALVTAPTRRYVARLREVTGARPDLWVAHHYVRFLGDVSGGQVVGRAVRDVYGPVGARATAFYDFSAVGPAPRFRSRYRDRLDAAPVPDVDAVVAEAVTAFAHNRAVFDALLPGGARPPGPA